MSTAIGHQAQRASTSAAILLEGRAFIALIVLIIVFALLSDSS